MKDTRLLCRRQEHAKHQVIFTTEPHFEAIFVYKIQMLHLNNSVFHAFQYINVIHGKNKGVKFTYKNN